MKIFIFTLLFFPLALSAQRYVSGRIIDAENKEPVVGASVFISNTTIGDFTDTGGHYKLKIPSEGSYQFTISHVGYKSVSIDIETGNESVEFNATLQINELQEVTITEKVRFRQSDINLFWKTVLGKNPSKKAIHVVNPETVYYHYNPETRILNVTCREPLQIINYETGYQILYVLDYFMHDYKKDFSDWSNKVNFIELKPENPRQKNNWEKKRREVYNSSLTKFIKSLYNNSLHEDGFVLAALRQNSDRNLPSYLSLLSPEDVLSQKAADNSKTLNLSNEQVILICYGRRMSIYDLSLRLNKNNGLYMNLLHGDSISIFPDGTYINKLLMAPVNYSSTLLGLNTKLPVEYQPVGSALTNKDDEKSFDLNGNPNQKQY